MSSLIDLSILYDIEIPDHLLADAEIPVLSGLQRQGDVIVIPADPGRGSGLSPIPDEGVAVVRGESGGHTHLLVGGGRWAEQVDDQSTLPGVLFVDDQPAYLLHPEHGGMGIGPGTYLLRRQREQTEAVRVVAD